MKIKTLTIGACLFLGLGAPQLHGQKASIYKTDVESTSFFLSDIRKISFSAGNLSVSHRSGEVYTLFLAEVSAIDFRNITSAVPQSDHRPATDAIAIYPNPVSEVLTLDLSSDPEAFGSLQILSIEGKVVYSEMINSHYSNYKIDMSSLNKGIYIIKVNTGSTFQTAKVIKH